MQIVGGFKSKDVTINPVPLALGLKRGDKVEILDGTIRDASRIISRRVSIARGKKPSVVRWNRLESSFGVVRDVVVYHGFVSVHVSVGDALVKFHPDLLKKVSE